MEVVTVQGNILACLPDSSAPIMAIFKLNAEFLGLPNTGSLYRLWCGIPGTSKIHSEGQT